MVLSSDISPHSSISLFLKAARIIFLLLQTKQSMSSKLSPQLSWPILDTVLVFAGNQAVRPTLLTVGLVRVVNCIIIIIVSAIILTIASLSWFDHFCVVTDKTVLLV